MLTLLAQKDGVKTMVVCIRESDVKVSVTGPETLDAKPRPLKVATPPIEVMLCEEVKRVPFSVKTADDATTETVTEAVLSEPSCWLICLS